MVEVGFLFQANLDLLYCFLPLSYFLSSFHFIDHFFYVSSYPYFNLFIYHFGFFLPFPVHSLRFPVLIFLDFLPLVAQSLLASDSPLFKILPSRSCSEGTSMLCHCLQVVCLKFLRASSLTLISCLLVSLLLSCY